MTLLNTSLNYFFLNTDDRFFAGNCSLTAFFELLDWTSGFNGWLSFASSCTGGASISLRPMLLSDELTIFSAETSGDGPSLSLG